MAKEMVIAAYGGQAEEADGVFAALPERSSLQQWKAFCHQYHVEHGLSDYLGMLLDTLVRGAEHLKAHINHVNQYYRARAPQARQAQAGRERSCS